MSKRARCEWTSLNASNPESDILIRLSDLKPPDPDASKPLWWDLLYPGAVTVMAGPPSIGKTTYSRRTVAIVAAGSPAEFLGWPGPREAINVLVIDFETPTAEQYRAWDDAFSDHPEAKMRVHLCLAESPIDVERVARFVTEYGIGLVVIDTLSAAFNFRDITSNSETEEAMKKLRRLARSTDAAVLVLAHSPKSKIDLLGAQAQKAAADVVKFYEPAGPDTEDANQYRISGCARSGARGKSRFGEILTMTFKRSGAGHFDVVGSGADQESTKASVRAVAEYLRGKGAVGGTTTEITADAGFASKTTVLNAIRDLRTAGRVRVDGKGKATRFFYVAGGDK